MRTSSFRERVSNNDAPDALFRVATMVTEIWKDWFHTVSQVAYQTHRACEFLAENGEQSIAQFGPFGFLSPRGRSDKTNGRIDIDQLRQCLQSMDPAQASKVVHAVQMMEATEAMLKRQQSGANDAERAAW